MKLGVTEGGTIGPEEIEAVPTDLRLVLDSKD